MALINYDVTLLIVEHLDMDSMASLMATCRANYQLIRSHERSVVMARIARIIHDPILRPPLGALLSSSAPRQPDLGRRVLQPLSFAVARELESRERQINTLFSPGQPFMEAFNRLPLFQHLPTNQTERLIDGLKDACRVADRIADCTVSVYLEQAPKTGCFKDGERAVEFEVHLSRQQYIRSLPPIRLAFLTLLAGLVGMMYVQRSVQQPPDSDPFQQERIIALKETFLRHGTAVISTLLSPREADHDESAQYYTSQVDAVLMEVLEYEGVHRTSSQPVADDDGRARRIPDGLHMTMLQAFQGSEEAEEVIQPREDVGEEEDGGDDSNWLFKIDILDHDTDDADESSSLWTSRTPDAREALILRWINQR